MANSGFESRMNLHRVLESVHRRNAYKAYESLGGTLPENATWQQIADAFETIPNEYVITWTVYAGRVLVDGLFGLNGWRLVESHPTGQVAENLDTFPDSYNSVHSHVTIELVRNKTLVEVLLMPDVPPVAMYYDDIDYVKRLYTGGIPRLMENDAEILGAVQQAFGDSAVYFLDETAARSLINALLNDESQSAIAT